MSQFTPVSDQTTTTVAIPGSLPPPSTRQHPPRQGPDTYELGPMVEGGQPGRQDQNGPDGDGEEGVDRQGRRADVEVTCCLLLYGSRGLSESEQRTGALGIVAWMAVAVAVWARIPYPERKVAVVAATAKGNVPYIMSTAGSTIIEDVDKAGGGERRF
ncbi:FMN dependent dehydrogenase [Apiospora saccharicola]|uniref:FMN dependent dehydrogenase n=1 Tax=Apiospora saccharicola TaxID=335842 RepID=A0ABR1UYD1_9PEZI